MKEQLVINELLYKYNLTEQSDRTDILKVYGQLIGNANMKRIKELAKSKKEKNNSRLNIFTLLVYALAFPSLKISNNYFENADSFYWKNRIGFYVEKIKKCSFSTARIIKKNKNGRLISFCSGFLISKNLLLSTAKPFIGNLSKSKRNERYWVDFSEHKKIPDLEQLFEVQDLLHINNNLKELFFLSLRENMNNGKTLPPPLKVSKENKNIDFILMIGYPMKMHKGFDIFKQYAVFGSPWQMGNKRVAPGHIFQNDSNQFYHDCSASIGNEGSPIISPESGKIIGIHLKQDKEDRNIARRLDLIHIKNQLKLIYKNPNQ